MGLFGRNENFTVRIIIYQLYFSNTKKIIKILCSNFSLTSVEKELVKASLLRKGEITMYVTEKELLNLLSVEKKYEKLMSMQRDTYRDRDKGNPNRKIG